MSVEDIQSRFFTLTQLDDVIVAEFTVSRLSDDENIEQLGRELFDLIEHHQFRKLVLDLESVVYVTSSALGKLITSHRKLHRRSGQLVLCHLTDGMREILDSSRLIDYFHVAPDVDSAVVMLES